LKLHELSDQDANRWVAEKLEPCPVLTAQWLIDKRYQSPKGFWTLQRHSNHPIEDMRSYYFRCRDFVTDPAMWSMLLEQMYEEYRYITFRQIVMKFSIEHTDTEINVIWRTKSSPEVFREHHAKTMGRAVVEAWMKSKGWTE